MLSGQRHLTNDYENTVTLKLGLQIIAYDKTKLLISVLAQMHVKR